ncbi:MAG: sodium:proton antiporter [Rikenellaceae bacterium]|nr:sodium:proton antiporter [Rikenellaceae bacterium]
MKKNNPSVIVSFVPIAVLVILLYIVIRAFGSDSLEGGSQVSLLAASAVCVAIAMLGYGVKWQTLEEAISKNIYSVGSAIIMLLLIGAIAGSWMASGVVPSLICYGLEIMHPKLFLVSCCAISAVVSLMTGSSWTTIATIGVALIGIGQAQGFDEGWIAGAIISGAYFGDKVSPLSDTTVLASSSAETPLFTHIRYMMITTVPSFTIALVVFTIVGFTHEISDPAQIAAFSASLRSTFNITPWLLIVPLFTLLLIIRKLPALITLFSSCLLAGIFLCIFQPEILHNISGADGFMGAFRGVMQSYYGSTAIETGNEALNELVATDGMAGMLHTVWLIVCAMCFGGVMAGSGMLANITAFFLRFVRRTVSIVASTVGAGLFCNMCTGDQYLSIILSSNLFKDLYKKQGLEPRLLSRSVEDSATVCSVLIPWNSCGMTQSTVLGVSTFVYFPYCIFNLISPVMSILVAAIGYKIIKNPTTAAE